MIKTLAVKELREVGGIVAVALAVNLALVSNLTGLGVFSWLPLIPARDDSVPFAGTSFVSFFSVISGLCALALGFRQSAWESTRDTYLFLLHRPVPRSTIFLTKLATGIGVFWIGAAVPVLVFAAWAATPGHHPSPFEWSMTGETWCLCFLLPLVYLGAFLSGLRPARWTGTRLLPLAACCIATALVALIPQWTWIGLPVTVVLYVVLIRLICYVACVRDY